MRTRRTCALESSPRRWLVDLFLKQLQGHSDVCKPSSPDASKMTLRQCLDRRRGSKRAPAVANAKSTRPFEALETAIGIIQNQRASRKLFGLQAGPGRLVPVTLRPGSSSTTALDRIQTTLTSLSRSRRRKRSRQFLPCSSKKGQPASTTTPELIATTAKANAVAKSKAVAALRPLKAPLIVAFESKGG